MIIYYHVVIVLVLVWLNTVVKQKGGPVTFSLSGRVMIKTKN
jgi:hypothetical protein